MIRKIIVASGYFDPIHIGHIEYLKAAKELGNELLVILNTDSDSVMKKGYIFMPFEERAVILAAIKYVDRVISSIDFDSTVNNTLALIHTRYKTNNNEIVFAKGGDRTEDEIPEKEICKKLGIKIVDGLGQKIQSSSELVKKIRNI